MGDGEACALRELLHRLDGQVGTDCPVSAEDDCHDNQQSNVVLTKRRQREQDEPVSGRCLLHLDVTGGEQGAALGDLVEADQQDVDDEGDEQELHCHGEALSKGLLNACGNCVLAVVRVDDACGQIEAVLQACQDRTEVGGQSAGTCVQDQHSDDGL